MILFRSMCLYTFIFLKIYFKIFKYQLYTFNQNFVRNKFSVNHYWLLLVGLIIVFSVVHFGCLASSP